ncbi:MAG: class I mannose-6-phosphate isomerase [Bryobacterales bacterium]|nr:class I mannose-6-phosphate isomerase [Bryobacterales bacterium]
MIRLARSFHPKVWGTHSLEPWFEDRPEKIGEVWFTHAPAPPLLVKFIFTAERLSVQVHPDDAYAAAHENSAGKTEMWHVLRAAPGATVAAGFRETITPERAREAALSGEIEHLLAWLPVEAGDTILIPAGTVHAIGAGLALCEIQQHSDVTYRLYDYGRPRQLHLERALEVAGLTPHPGKAVPRTAPDGALILAECPYFATELVTLPRGGHRLAARGAQILIAIEGAGALNGERFTAAEAWLVPKGCAAVSIQADRTIRLLRTWAPGPY